MRFILTPIGSGGDVLPYVGIGRRLRERGHEVMLLAAEPFRSAAEGAGLAFFSVWSREDYEEGIRHRDLWSPTRSLRYILGLIGRLMGGAYERLLELHLPGKTVLVGHTLALATRVLEETHRIPSATLHLAPSVFRSDFDQPALGPGTDISRWPRWSKRIFWWAVDRFLIDPSIVPALNSFRAGLGLPPVRRIFRSWIHSPRLTIGLFPEWFGPPQPDWPASVRLTGFPLFDDPGRGGLPPDLEAFLTAGEPPVVFTAGTGNVQAERFFRTAAEASRLLDRRALLLTGHREQVPASLPPGVLHAPYAPFSKLLPCSAAIVHHGGIGTSSAGLAAGIPQLIMPLAFDQPDNTHRLRRLNAGRWIMPSRFSPRRVARALEVLLGSREVAEACRDLRDRIAGQDAIAETCDLLEGLQTPRPATQQPGNTHKNTAT